MANPIRRSVRLLLVGTVHLDPRGQHRLLGLLRDWKPEAIAIEVSPYAVQFRQSQGAGWRARLERFRLPDQSLPGGLDAVEAKLRLPFEYTAARAHARAANVPLHLLGDSERSRQLLDLLVAEMMTEENLERLSVPSEMGTLEERVEAEWRLAKRRFATGCLMGTAEACRIAAEDAAMAERIRSLGAGDRWVHVCGWEHLRGLSAELSDLTPEIRLLCAE